MKGFGLNEKNRRNRGGVVSTHSRVNIGSSGAGKAAAIYRNTQCPANNRSSYCNGSYWLGMCLHPIGFLSRAKSLYPEWGRYFGSGVWGAIHRVANQQVYQLQKTITHFILKNFIGLSVGLGFDFAGL